jgi:peptidoglycan/LPS O-acetylase OafA/YrhL
VSGKSSHLDALTGIRGIAAWLVVFYHTRKALTEIWHPEAISMLANGYLAVDLFFMLSGFVIFYNYTDRLAGGDGVEIRQFLWRRFARVWPLHGFILAVYLAFVGVLFATGRDISHYPLGDLPLNLILAHNWGFTDALAWNVPSWSISTEFAAYLAFPLAVMAVPWKRLDLPALFGLAAVLMIGLHLIFLLSGYSKIGQNIPQMGIWRCLFGFALGMVLCALWQRLRGTPGVAPVAAASCAALLVAGFALGLPDSLFVPAAFFAGLLALVTGKGVVVRFLSSRPALYLGEISYSTYLGHYLLWQLWKIAFVGDTVQVGWLSFAGYLTLVFAASVALYHWVEKPAQRWLNTHAPRWTVRPAAVPAE